MDDVSATPEPTPTCRKCGSPITGRKRRKQKFCSRTCFAHARRVVPSNSPWTPERQALLRKLWPEMSAGEIAKQFGITKNAVMGRLDRQGQLKTRNAVIGRLSRQGQATSRGATLSDKDFVGCRWIEGEPSPLRRGMFCCKPVGQYLDGRASSLCQEHHARAHVIKVPAVVKALLEVAS